jgi:hypothetical protein
MAFALCVLATTAACGSEQIGADDNTTASAKAPDSAAKPAPTTDGASCPADGWQTIDAGDFSFRLPPGVEDQEAQGVDSQVGLYEGHGLSVAYDYGSYTNDFSEAAARGTTEEVTINGLDGRLNVSDSASNAGFALPFDTAVYVINDQASDKPATTGAALGLSVTFADESAAPGAECIVRSVDFEA